METWLSCAHLLGMDFLDPDFGNGPTTDLLHRSEGLTEPCSLRFEVADQKWYFTLTSTWWSVTAPRRCHEE
jgi:hypothetical protein